MKPKKEIALNKLFNFLQILGLLLLAIGIALLIETEIYWGLGFCIPAIAVIILTGFFTPACYIFSNDSVTFYYLFSKNEQYLWENIYSITVDYDRFAPHSSSGIFSLFFGSAFLIEGNATDELLFYMSGYIRKSFRTSYLLKKYYDGEINGFFWEDVKKRFSKNFKRQM